MKSLDDCYLRGCQTLCASNAKLRHSLCELARPCFSRSRCTQENAERIRVMAAGDGRVKAIYHQIEGLFGRPISLPSAFENRIARVLYLSYLSRTWLNVFKNFIEFLWPSQPLHWLPFRYLIPNNSSLVLFTWTSISNIRIRLLSLLWSLRGSACSNCSTFVWNSLVEILQLDFWVQSNRSSSLFLNEPRNIVVVRGDAGICAYASSIKFTRLFTRLRYYAPYGRVVAQSEENFAWFRALSSVVLPGTRRVWEG